MKEAKKHFVIRSKIWIDDEQGKVVFGEGRYLILETVDRLKSLNAAAKELKMSYRALWGKIKASEQRLGQSLVMKEGKGSRLTPFAEKLLVQYRKLQETIREESDGVYDSLVARYLSQ
ncbi:MAG TPA: ModE family transcriptional regulator [Desulfobulbaceae bacterium]|nr:ModE family transcriptional regulator [Desulfobulbaceae bacterium]